MTPTPSATAPPETDAQDLTLTERELASRLWWFIGIRWFTAAAVFVLVVLAHNVFYIRFDAASVLACCIVLLLYNAILAVTVRGLQARGTLSRRSIHLLGNIQVIADLLILAAIWHFVGAVENAFGVFLIFPMIWASELLGTRNALAHAVLGAVLVNVVVWGEYAGLIPHVHLVRESALADIFIRPTVYHDWDRVLMVSTSLSAAMFVTVFLAATVAGRLRQRENQLEQAFNTLQTLDVLKTRFMRRASHELRAPLAATHTLLKTVLAGLLGEVNPKQYEMIERALGRIDSLQDLINDLLRHSRLEAEAGLAVRYEPISFTDVVRRTTDLLAPSAESAGITLHTRIHPARVAADEEGLTELVTNLVSNAIRYSRSGGDVKVTLECSDASALLRVEDRGIGIAAEDLPHVFEEFFRSPDARQFVRHGTGMGLAIVKRLVESYRGQIAVESQHGNGTTVTVTLPLVP